MAVGLVARLRERRVDGLEEGEGGIDAAGLPAEGGRVEAGDRVRVETGSGPWSLIVSTREGQIRLKAALRDIHRP